MMDTKIFVLLLVLILALSAVAVVYFRAAQQETVGAVAAETQGEAGAQKRSLQIGSSQIRGGGAADKPQKIGTVSVEAGGTTSVEIVG